MKKFILLIFLSFILVLAFFIMTTQNQLKTYLLKSTTTSIPTTPTTLSQGDINIIDKTISEDIDNYIIDIHYPQTQIQIIDDNIYDHIEKQIKEFKEAVSIPSPNGAKTTLMINYKTVFNQEDVLSIKFETEAYTGGAHPSHLIWTKNFIVSDQAEIPFDHVITNDLMLKTIADYSLKYFKDQKLEYNLFEEGFEPKKENYQVFNLTKDTIVIYFNEYQIAPYAAGNFSIEIPYEVLDAASLDDSN